MSWATEVCALLLRNEGLHREPALKSPLFGGQTVLIYVDALYREAPKVISIRRPTEIQPGNCSKNGRKITSTD